MVSKSTIVAYACPKCPLIDPHSELSSILHRGLGLSESSPYVPFPASFPVPQCSVPLPTGGIGHLDSWLLVTQQTVSSGKMPTWESPLVQLVPFQLIALSVGSFNTQSIMRCSSVSGFASLDSVAHRDHVTCVGPSTPRPT